MKSRKKKILILLIMISAMLFVSLFGCTIPMLLDIINAAGKNKPTWDEKINLPILRRTIVLDDYFVTKPVANYNTSISPIIQWPPPSFIVYNKFGIVSAVETSVDFATSGGTPDGTPDFAIDGFRSTDATLVLKLWLTDVFDVTRDITADVIGIGNVNIEGIDYIFGPAVKNNMVLEYTSLNFLDATHDYYLALNGDPSADGSKLNVQMLMINLNTDPTPDYLPAALGGPGPYKLHIEADFDFGNTFEIVGRIINPATIISDSANISGLLKSYSQVSNFKFSFVFKNGLPFGLDMSIMFLQTIHPTRDM
jgi:hypothetical protein